MKTLVLTIIIVFCSTLINAKEYFFCEEDLFGEGRSNTKNFILDYKSHEKDEIILAYKFSDYDVSILRFIQEEQVLFESFRESILNNTFDINDSDNDKNFLIDRRRYTIKIIKKTPIEWFGVTFLKENFKNFDTYRNSHEFKINVHSVSSFKPFSKLDISKIPLFPFCMKSSVIWTNTFDLFHHFLFNNTFNVSASS